MLGFTIIYIAGLLLIFVLICMIELLRKEVQIKETQLETLEEYIREIKK